MVFLLLLAVAASAQTESSWPRDQTSHFVVARENPASSPGNQNLIERLYESLHPDLRLLVPWMTTKKVEVYLYLDRDAFLKGRFSPPPWSRGLLADADGEKALVLYEPLDAATAAHELTHLYFHSFFDGGKAPAPSWLDEGLATMLQDEALSLPDPRELGPVLKAPMPLASLFKTRPSKDAPADRVGPWYLQASSVVRFLKRAHIEDSFADFCAKLRDGSDLETALREVYGYADLAAFEQDWRRWRPKKAKGLPVGLDDR